MPEERKKRVPPPPPPPPSGNVNITNTNTVGNKGQIISDINSLIPKISIEFRVMALKVIAHGDSFWRREQHIYIYIYIYTHKKIQSTDHAVIKNVTTENVFPDEWQETICHVTSYSDPKAGQGCQMSTPCLEP